MKILIQKQTEWKPVMAETQEDIRGHIPNLQLGVSSLVTGDLTETDMVSFMTKVIIIKTAWKTLIGIKVE